MSCDIIKALWRSAAEARLATFKVGERVRHRRTHHSGFVTLVTKTSVHVRWTIDNQISRCSPDNVLHEGEES